MRAIEILGSGLTDANGVVTFARSLIRGVQSNALVAILAYRDDDFGFLTFGSERLDLSRLNVDGRPLTNGLNAFLTTDRGIYQPGETVRLLALVRNAEGSTPEPGPAATVRLETRDRTLVQRRLGPQDWMLGGATVPIEIPRTARAGTARITLSVGTGEDALIGETIVQLGPVRPDRARLQFVDQKNWQVRRTANETIDIAGRVSAQYLFASSGTRQGAARDLKAEVLVKVAATESPVRGCYESFAFGRFDDQSIPASSRHFIEYTDKDGNLDLQLAGVPFPRGSKPLAANVEVILVRCFGTPCQPEHGVSDRRRPGLGRHLEDSDGAAGIKAGAFDLDVDLISITPDNKLLADRMFDFTLERERDFYVWQQSDGAWQHVKSVRRKSVPTRPIAGDRLPRGAAASSPDGVSCAPTMKATEVARNLDVGRYVLTVTDRQTKRESTMRFSTGAAATVADQLEPNIFTLSTDKRIYRVNEPIEITAEASFDGEVLVAFADGDIRHWASGQARNGVAKIRLAARQEWMGKGLYALATVFRSGTDGTVTAGPARAIGATHFEVKGSKPATRLPSKKPAPQLAAMSRPMSRSRSKSALRMQPADALRAHRPMHMPLPSSSMRDC